MNKPTTSEFNKNVKESFDKLKDSREFDCEKQPLTHDDEYTTMHITSEQLNERMQLTGSTNHVVNFVNDNGCIESKPVDITKSKEDNDQL